MADLFLLSDAEVRRIGGYFRSRRDRSGDDRRIVSAIVFVLKNGLRWSDAPKEYGRTTVYNGFIRRSRLDVFSKIFGGGASPI